MQVFKAYTTLPPSIPGKYDRETLVGFACNCARDLASLLPDSDAEVTSPRSVKVLQELIEHRYPRLIHDICPLRLKSTVARSVVRGFTATKRAADPIHGRRPGVIYLTEVGSKIEYDFALAHELFQRVLDIPSLGLPPLLTHINRVYNYMKDPKWRDADISTVQEFLPEIAAVEYFMPYSHRSALLASRDNLEPIVARFQVPKAFVNLHLSDDFMNYFGPFHSSTEPTSP